MLVRLLRLNLRIGQGLLLAMVAVIAIEVFARSFLNRSLQVSEELSGYFLVGVMFLGVGASLRGGALLRVDLVYGRLRPRVQATLHAAFDLVALAVAVVYLWQLARFVLSSFERETVAATVLATPLFLPQLLMPLGMVFLLLALLDDLAHAVRRACGRESARGEASRATLER